jgi:hypothetical protein
LGESIEEPRLDADGEPRHLHRLREGVDEDTRGDGETLPSREAIGG